MKSRLWRGLARAVLAVPVAAGWLAGAVWLVATFAVAAVVVGWQQAGPR